MRHNKKGLDIMKTRLYTVGTDGYLQWRHCDIGALQVEGTGYILEIFRDCNLQEVREQLTSIMTALIAAEARAKAPDFDRDGALAMLRGDD